MLAKLRTFDGIEIASLMFLVASPSEYEHALIGDDNIALHKAIII
jgi:hypothetical protein